ncbi:unnamed protein product [Symbiodinium natans]|uniref:Uncharacterized protein n=1 Tax=Symbiodinium natans TaxID=878477 RepID=A0A812GIX1_9DINO|nr:unnamed protein product [Symbiodinium natans]
MDSVDDAERLQLIYENIVGLATAGVVTVLPSAEELAEGLAHLNLHPKDDAELSACLWVLEGALGECPAPSFQEFLMKATDLSHSPTASLGSNLSSDRPDCLQLAQGGGSRGFPSPQSFFSSEDEADEEGSQEVEDRSQQMRSLRASWRSSLRASPSPVQLTFPDQHDLVSFLRDALERMSLLQKEVKSSSALELSSFIQDLLVGALNQAQELERNVASAVEAARRSRELVQQSWDQSKSLVAELGRAQAESERWRAKWTATFSDLEVLRRKQASVLAQARAQAASLSGEPGSSLNRGASSLGRLLRRSAGPAAIAFAWFRASAALGQVRRRRAAEMDKLASAHCLERLRRRLHAGRGSGGPSPAPSPVSSSRAPRLALDFQRSPRTSHLGVV